MTIMTKSKVIFCLCTCAANLCLATWSCRVVGEPIASKSDHAALTISQPIDGMQLTAQFPQDQVMQSQPVIVVVTLKNFTSDERSFYQTITPEHDFTFKLADSAGKQVPMTRYELQVHNLYVGGYYSIPGGRLGGHHEAVYTFDLSVLFDMTILDTYTLTVEHEVNSRDRKPSGVYLRSDIIKVTVTTPFYTQATDNIMK